MRTVNPQEIVQLYQFTRAHFVEYYDLQTELVDHLANDMEVIWQKQPKLSFEQARDASFKKFGVFGFMDVVGERQKAMNTRYYKFFWNELRQWFSLPKIVMTISMFIVFFVAFSTPIAFHLSIGCYVALIIFGLYKFIRLRNAYKLRQKRLNKKWLLEDFIFIQSGVIGLFLLTQQFILRFFSKAIFENFYAIIGVSLVFTILCLVLYISFQLLPNKAEELLNQTYPEYSL